MVLNTDILLLDEPTANLDPQSTAIIEDVIEQVNHDHETTIIIATHNLFQAEALTERGAIFLEGQLAETGALHKILNMSSHAAQQFKRPDNPFSGTSSLIIVNT